MNVNVNLRGESVIQINGGITIEVQGFLSRTLATHRTAGKGRGPSFIPVYHFQPLTNIQTFSCNFVCEMTIIYFCAIKIVFTRLLLDEIYHLIELPFD